MDEALTVDVETAASIVGLGRTTLYKHVMAGDLPSIRIGKRRLIRRAALHDWLERLEREVANVGSVGLASSVA
jgi:excisionase family DNA binding protein